MKSYRFLVPIALVLIFVLSIFSLYSGKAEVQSEYEGHLAQARSYREQGIYVDALASYKLALEVKPSMELYLEVSDLYEEHEMNRLNAELSEELLSMYPNDVRAYELAMDIYLQQRDYSAAFDLMSTVEKRGLTSEKLDASIAAVEYQFFFKSDYVNVGVYAGGMCPVQIGDKWGYIDLYVNQSVAAKFVKVGPFSATDGIAPVVDADGSAYFIDTNGYKKKVILNVENVQELGLIENDLFRLYNGSFWGFYQTDGTHVFGEYEAVSNIGNGVAAVMNGGAWKLVDRTGADLTGKTYAAVAMDEKELVYRNERFVVSDGSGWYLIDATGKVCSDTYEDARLFNDGTYAAVKINGKWGFVDKNGEVVIDAQYEDARSFSNGFAAVKTEGRWGFIDLNGEMVIAPAFLDSKDFSSQGTVYVLTGDEWELLVLYKYNH